MPSIAKLEQAPRKDLCIFYVLDSSGSMAGEKIARLNRAMEETITALKDVARTNSDARLKVAVMKFDSDFEWITPNGPEYLESDFQYENIQAGGLTEIGSALRELNDKLSVKKFMKSAAGSFMPVIIFMSDGLPTDEWEKPLREIRSNKWFTRAIKIGFKIYDDDDDSLTREEGVKVLASIVGNSEAVIETSDLDFFARLIKFVSVTSSMVVSQSATSSTAPTGASIIQMAENVPEGAVQHLPDSDYNPEPEPSGGDWDDSDW